MYSEDSSLNSKGGSLNYPAKINYRDMLVDKLMLLKIQSMETKLEFYDVSILGLNRRAINRLRRVGINTLYDLTCCKNSDLLYLPRLGATTLKEIKTNLNIHLNLILSRDN